MLNCTSARNGLLMTTVSVADLWPVKDFVLSRATMEPVSHVLRRRFVIRGVVHPQLVRTSAISSGSSYTLVISNANSGWEPRATVPKSCDLTLNIFCAHCWASARDAPAASTANRLVMMSRLRITEATSLFQVACNRSARPPPRMSRIRRAFRGRRQRTPRGQCRVCR